MWDNDVLVLILSYDETNDGCCHGGESFEAIFFFFDDYVGGCRGEILKAILL